MYLMGSLPPPMLNSLRHTILDAPGVRGVLDDTAAFIRAMRSAASALRSEPE
jgi:hypothetical protein